MNQDQAFRENVTNHLKTGAMNVTFTKKNGDIRTLKCTLSPDFLPELKNSDKKLSETSLSVFDLENHEWRAFNWESVKEVQYL